MQKLLRWTVRVVAGFMLCFVISAAMFDGIVVRPAAAKIQTSIASAAPAERKPPSDLVALLQRAYGTRLTYLVARDALLTAPSQVERLSKLGRRFTELGVGLMLPLHLSQSEVEVAFLSQAYMGPGVRGFDQASKQYLGAGLQDLSTKQAAKLVAIVHAPTAYLASPERLERRAQYLLSLQPQ